MSFMPGLFTAKEKLKCEIPVDSKIRAVAFLGDDGPRIVSGEESTIQLRQTGDDLMATPIESGTDVLSVAASKDGRWIVTGTTDGFAIWNRLGGGGFPARMAHRPIGAVRAIDISPDSKWVATGSDAFTADVWDVSTGDTRPGLGPLKHEYNVVAVKFCPCGERIVTATLFGSVRVYSSSSGERLFTITVSVTSNLSIPSTPLAWFFNGDRPLIFVVSMGHVKCLDSINGSLVFQWPIRGTAHPASVAVSPNGRIIACATNQTVVLRDTATRQQIGDPLKHDTNVSCIAFSPGSDQLAVGADTKFTIWNLPVLLTDPSYFVDTTVGNSRVCMHPNADTSRKSSLPTFLLPLMSISNGAVKPWLHNFFDSAEEVFTKEIEHATPSYHTFANRALVRGHRENVRMALEDAEKSLAIQPSAIGHIAKTLALCHQGQPELARRGIPNVFETGHSDEHTFLLKVIQNILLCLSGDFEGGLSQLKKLTMGRNPKDFNLCYLVQANIHLTQKHFEAALTSVKNAHVPTMFYESQEMCTISLIFGWKFNGLGLQIQQRKCQSLLDDDDPEAARLLLEVMHTYDREIVMNVEQSDWVSDFRTACVQKLEDLGNKAFHSKLYEPAIRHYTAVISLVNDLEQKHALLLKRSKAYVRSCKWLDASKDADEAIRLNSMSPWGFDCRHEALYASQYYAEAVEALDQMILLLEVSTDEKFVELRNKGVKPCQTRETIGAAINDILAHDAAHPWPHVLINTKSGHLCDEQKQTEAFRADPKYKQLVLSPPSLFDESDIKTIVRQFFRYSMLSHTWEVDGEPQFIDVDGRSVKDLVKSIPNTKLQTFCEIALKHGFLWAWSDTCCINKADKNILDMALRSMYRWYSESSLTIVHLKGVFRQLEAEVLSRILEELLAEFVRCRWNERAWTLQEYFASKVLHFYTEEWKPYLPISFSDPDSTNHKKFLAIKQGMELVTGCSAKDLDTLRPGSDDARQKLRLAATRRATRREDIAYSLLGILNVAIPAIYGDDEVPRALGRLLGALLTQSADVTILAWTGKPSEYNTCLPAEITVYQEPESHYIPTPIEQEELASSVASLRSSLSASPTDLNSAVRFYDLLRDFPPPELHHGRLKLPCIWFSLPSIAWLQSPRTRAESDSLLKKVEITNGWDFDLSGSRNMILVHPWFSSLLDWGAPRSEASAQRESALRLLARLREPFGALLLEPWSNTSRDYKRIASEQLITVQIREDVTAKQLLDNVGVLYIR